MRILSILASRVIQPFTTLRATVAFILGSADTSGVRLDLESGSLAVREGDDSAYAPILASIVTASGTGNAILAPNGSMLAGADIKAGDTGTAVIGWQGGAHAKLLSPGDGWLRVTNIAGTDIADLVVAAWGTTLSAEGVSVADAGTLNLGAAPLGLLTITVGTDNLVGRFQLRGSTNAVVADDGNDAIFTTTKDTATSINVYFDTNAYFIQNTRGGARTLRVLLIGG